MNNIIKKVLKLAAFLLCSLQVVHAGPFEDICQREGIDEQFLKEGKPIPQGKRTDQAIAGVIMDYYNPFLVALIPLADGNNPEHERIIRRLIHFYCYHVKGSKWMHDSLSIFQGGSFTFDQFLTYAKEHVDEIFPKRIELAVGEWLCAPLVPFERRELLG